MNFSLSKRHICADDGEMGKSQVKRKKRAETISEYDYLGRLISECDVVIREANDSSSGMRFIMFETRWMKREINFVEVAWRSIALYWGLSHSLLTTNWLSCNENNFRSAFGVALFFEHLFTLYIDRMCDVGATWKDEDDTIEKKTVVHGVSMFELLPTITKSKALLVSIVEARRGWVPRPKRNWDGQYGTWWGRRRQRTWTYCVGRRSRYCWVEFANEWNYSTF